MNPAPVPTPGPIGSSELELAVNDARPMPPDVPTENVAPGGVLVPLTPFPAAGEQIPTTRRNQYTLNFNAPQGQQLTLRRIYLSLPVLLFEDGLEETSAINRTTTGYNFASEKEGREYEEKAEKEGVLESTIDETAIGYDQRHERTATTFKRERVGDVVTLTEELAISRSVLPVTLTVVTTLFAPGGALWSESFEVGIYPTGGIGGGSFEGVGQLNAYADLVNAIPLRPDQEVYGFGLSILLPGRVNTHPVIGVDKSGGIPSGLVTFFFDIEQANLGK
jgi:hypothetical protein